MTRTLLLLVATLSFLVAPSSGQRVHRVRRVVDGAPVPVPVTCSVPYIVIVEKTCQTAGGAPIVVNFRCAGTIIDQLDVVTSKQCVRTGLPAGCDRVTQIRVIAGAHLFLDENELGRQVALSRMVAQHPDPTVDLAVINLDRNLTLRPAWLEAAALPTAPPTINSRYQAAGWGRQVVGNQGTYAASLMTVNLTVSLVTDNVITLSHENDTQVNSGVYEGDSGGPIVMYDREADCFNPRLMAVTSCPPGGANCGNRAAQHANVFTQRTWILWHQEHDLSVSIQASITMMMGSLLFVLLCIC